MLVENIAFAIGVKIIFALLALTGNATMWMAVFADTGTCLIVVANAMRMLRMKPRLDRMAEEARRAASTRPPHASGFKRLRHSRRRHVQQEAAAES